MVVGHPHRGRPTRGRRRAGRPPASGDVDRPRGHRRPAERDLVGHAPRGRAPWGDGRRRRRRPHGLRPARRRHADPRARWLPGAAQLVPAAQARDQPDAGARPGRPGAAVPAHLQAGLGPAWRCRRGRRVAAAAVSREIEEELGLAIPAGPLLLTDWLPPWSGWDDALCLVFDGGTHDAAVAGSIVRQEREIKDAAFCTLDEAAERCSEITSHRIASALANVEAVPPATPRADAEAVRRPSPRIDSPTHVQGGGTDGRGTGRTGRAQGRVDRVRRRAGHRPRVDLARVLIGGDHRRRSPRWPASTHPGS